MKKNKLISVFSLLFLFVVLVFGLSTYQKYKTSQDLFGTLDGFSLETDILYDTPEFIDLVDQNPQGIHLHAYQILADSQVGSIPLEKIFSALGLSPESYYNGLMEVFNTTPDDLSYVFSNKERVVEVSKSLILKNMLYPVNDELYFFEDNIEGMLACRDSCESAFLSLLVEEDGEVVMNNFLLKGFSREEVYEVLFTLNQEEGPRETHPF